MEQWNNRAIVMTKPNWLFWNVLVGNFYIVCVRFMEQWNNRAIVITKPNWYVNITLKCMCWNNKTWNNGTTEQWNNGTMEQRNNGTTAQQHNILCNPTYLSKTLMRYLWYQYHILKTCVSSWNNKTTASASASASSSVSRWRYYSSSTKIMQMLLSKLIA